MLWYSNPDSRILYLTHELHLFTVHVDTNETLRQAANRLIIQIIDQTATHALLIPSPLP